MTDSVDLKLKKIVENIEALEEKKSEISEEIKEVYKEAYGLGFNTKIIKKLIALRKMDQDQRVEIEQLLETYKEALGMI